MLWDGEFWLPILHEMFEAGLPTCSAQIYNFLIISLRYKHAHPFLICFEISICQKPIWISPLAILYIYFYYKLFTKYEHFAKLMFVFTNPEPNMNLRN